MGDRDAVESVTGITWNTHWIDCYDSPIPWRYFSELGPAFEAHAAEYLSEFKFLEDTLIQYRLMDTEIYGVLPEQPDAANEAKDTGQ